MVKAIASGCAIMMVLAVHGSLSQPLPKGNITVGGPGGGYGSGGPINSGIPGTPIVGCSNTLDFSDACNSQYLGSVI